MDQVDSSLWLDMSLEDIAKMRKEKAGGGEKAKKKAPSEKKPNNNKAVGGENHPYQSAKLCNNCYKPGHLSKECNAQRACGVCGKADHLRADCALKDKSCDRCKKVGHLKAVCKQQQLPPGARAAMNQAVGAAVLPPAPANTAAKACFGCGSFAHAKKECPHKTHACENCGKLGHFPALCRTQKA